MIITDITPQKKNPRRINIYLDGLYAFSLEKELILTYHLTLNKEISNREVERLIQENEVGGWYARLLKLIAARPRSRKELTDFLKSHEVGERTEKILLEKLESQKLLNDYSFALWFIGERLVFRPRSRRFLEAELKLKGVVDSVINKALDEALSKQSEAKTVVFLARKKLKRFATLPKTVQRYKIQTLLARYGYSWEVVKQAVIELGLA